MNFTIKCPTLRVMLLKTLVVFQGSYNLGRRGKFIILDDPRRIMFGGLVTWPVGVLQVMFLSLWWCSPSHSKECPNTSVRNEHIKAAQPVCFHFLFQFSFCHACILIVCKDYNQKYLDHSTSRRTSSTTEDVSKLVRLVLQMIQFQS